MYNTKTFVIFVFTQFYHIGQHDALPVVCLASEKLCKNGAIGRLNDADALAAALIVLGKYPLSGNKDLLAGLMQTDKKKINSVLRIINKDDDC